MKSIEPVPRAAHHFHDALKPPTLSEGKKKTIRSLQLGSLGLQTAGTVWEIVQGGVSAVNTRILLLMAHDVNDVAGWELDLRQDRGELSEPARQRTEKMAHWAIATGGAYTAVEGGAAAAGVRWHEGSHNLLNTIAATGATGVAAVTTGLVVAGVMKSYGSVKRLWQQARGGDAEANKDKKRLLHGVTDVMTAGAVLADTTDVLSSQSSGILAGLGGLACLFYFRPTKKNLELGHVCVAHDHEDAHSHSHESHSYDYNHHHEDRHHVQHDHSTEQFDKKRAKRRVAVRLGVVAAALAGGVIAGGMIGGSYDSSELPALPSVTEPPTTLVHNGDTMWGLVRDHAAMVTGEIPSDRAVYDLVQATAHVNSSQVPNPHRIYPGFKLILPSDELVQAKVLYN